MRNTEDWKVVSKDPVDFSRYGFAGTIELSYSESLETYRYRVYNVSGASFLQDYGTDPNLQTLLAKLRELKAEWRKQYTTKG